MTKEHEISTLFLDIGGVLLTNGWDRFARQRAAETFHIDFEDMDERHHLTFDTYEEGQLSMDEYLDRVVFHKERNFAREEFRQFMFDCSKPYPEMMGLIRQLKNEYRLKTVAVSNEGRELTLHRIQQFHLDEIIDLFVSSCFVHRRKPDEEIYQFALDISQSVPDQVAYLEDRLLFVEVANSLHLHGIHHTSMPTTQAALEGLGLKIR